MALKDDGSVVAWGSLGQTTVPVEARSGVTAIAAGAAHTVVLKNDGSVVAWGFTEPVPVEAQNGVTAIAAGSQHTIALKNDGTLVAWGAGNLDTGFSPNFGQSIVPAGLSSVTAIAAGRYHTVALLGTPVCLQAKHIGNDIILYWPTNAAGFKLQWAPNLSSPMTWFDFTNPPTVIAAQFTVTNTISGSGRFFRLSKP